MIDWVKLVEGGNLPTIIIIFIIALLTGGVGATLVSNHGANKRGIRGDALVKEQNGIDGLNKLSIAQDKELVRQNQEIIRQDAKIVELEQGLEDVKKEMRLEIEYSNSLIAQLIEKGITPHTRPRHAE